MNVLDSLLASVQNKPIFPCPQTRELMDLGPLHTGIYTSRPLVLRPSDLHWMIPAAFLVLQFADSRLWDFSASITNSYNKCPLNIVISQGMYPQGPGSSLHHLDIRILRCSITFHKMVQHSWPSGCRGSASGVCWILGCRTRRYGTVSIYPTASVFTENANTDNTNSQL